MKILPPEIEIDLYEEGFGEDDLLQRKKTGAALSDLLNRIDDPLTVAVDGQWGTGKTYFLKRWVGEHRNANGEKPIVVYFDAFQNDYLGEPLFALISALEERVAALGKGGGPIEKLKEVSLRLRPWVKPLIRAALAAAGASAVTAAFDELAKARDTEKGCKDSSSDFWGEERARRIALEEFRQALQSLAVSSEETGENGDESSRVIIVIDELDRCRPDYALEVLEIVKHLFSVPRLHFVLGVNLNALENMVRARYGQKSDAQAYLRKFIQVTLDLPNEIGPSHHPAQKAVLLYLNRLLEYMEIPEHINDYLRRHVKIVSRSNRISLRDVENIVSIVSLADIEYLKNQRILPGWAIAATDLIVSKVVRNDLYSKFLNATISDSELKSYLSITDNMLEEQLENGKHNPDFDYEARFIFYIWLCISGNKENRTLEPAVQAELYRVFDTFGSELNLQKIPMEVYRQRLNRFRFFNDQ